MTDVPETAATAPPTAATAPPTPVGIPAQGPGPDAASGRIDARDHAGAAVQPGADPAGDALSQTVAALTEEDLPAPQRRKLLGRLAGEVRARGIADLFKPRAAMRWIADAVSDVTPYLPIRDLQTLRRHHDGLDGEALAERLIRNAAIATASVGAAGGGVAAVEWVATPTLLSAPVLLAAETVAVVAIEIKLIGELHEVYGQPVPGTGTQRGVALIHSWAQRRGVNPMMPGLGVAVLGTTLRKELRDRLLRRFGRNLTTLGPFLTGAAVASFLNRRATIALADHIRRDLRQPAPGIIHGEVATRGTDPSRALPGKPAEGSPPPRQP